MMVALVLFTCMRHMLSITTKARDRRGLRGMSHQLLVGTARWQTLPSLMAVVWPVWSTERCFDVFCSAVRKG
jgi:hypothetical protein